MFNPLLFCVSGFVNVLSMRGLKSGCSLTGLAGPAPPSGDTCGSRGDAGAGGGQAHRRHTAVELCWGRQLQKGDVVIEVLGVVVGVRDGLDGEVNVNYKHI